MSLVAYDSSDNSDSEETSTSAGSRGTSGGLFSVLPAPKKHGTSAAGSGAAAASTASRLTRVKPPARDNDEPELPPPSTGGFFSSLPKPKKRSEPVKIPVPKIQTQDSDSDDDEPAKKKKQPPPSAGSGLSALLPQPKNLSLKETARALIPHTLTKRPEPKGARPGGPGPPRGGLGSSASPSAIKAAAKSAALQLARQIAADEDEDDITPQNYFSLSESTQLLPPVVPSLDPEPVALAELPPPPPVLAAAPAPAPAAAPAAAPAGDDDDDDGPGQSNAPLDFGGGQDGAGAWGAQCSQYPQPMTGPEEYYDESYYPDPDPALSEDGEEPGQSALFDDEGFMRLQGKRNRGKEEVKFLEIKGDDQLSGAQQWLTKNMSEEKQHRQSFSKSKGGQPTGQQRRKHQITYLIHQAKERELELKNNWAENKMTRRQTQAKYGF